MANYFSVSSGNITDEGVFNRSIDAADKINAVAYKTLDTTYVNCLPIPGNNTIYGLAVNLYLRSATPIGTFNVQIVSPSGSIVSTETYDVELFTKHDGRNNYISINPLNWQILALETPLNLNESGNYTLKFKTSEKDQLSLMGDSTGYNDVNFERYDVAGNIVRNSPFSDPAEESIQGTLIPKKSLTEYGLGVEDFTVEGFYYFNSFNIEWNPLINFGPGWDRLVSRGPETFVRGQYSAWGIAYNHNQKRLYFYRFSPRGERSINARCTLELKKWYHIAVSRKGDTLKIWVDGVCIYGSPVSRVNYSALRNKKLQIGQLIKTPTIASFPGEVLTQKTFISDMCVTNIRITTEVDRYLNEFPTPVDPLSLRINTPFLYSHPYNNTYLSTDSNGIITEKTFDIPAIIFNDIDELQYVRTGTATSSLTASNPFVTAEDYSLIFTGASFYTGVISYGNFTTGDFTLEMWINPSSTTGTSRICTYSTASVATADSLFGVEIINGTLAAYVVSSAKAKLNLLQGAVSTDRWQHIAVVRENTTLTTYIDGIATGAALTIPDKLNKLISPTLSFGAQRNNTLFYKGGLTNLRLIRGTALYTSNFNTVTPTYGANINSPEPLEGLTGNVNVDGLLVIQPVAYDAANSTDFYTCTPTLTLSSDSPVTGEYSMSLTRSQADTARVLLDYSSTANIGGADFTIESWVKLSSLPADDTITSSFMLFNVSTTSTDGYGVLIGRTKIYMVGAGGTIKYAESTHDINVSTWCHIACTRKNGFIKFYINGVYLGVTSLFDILTPYTVTATSQIYVGSRTGTACFFNGLISNLRIIRGKCLYLADFNVTPVVDGANISAPVPLTNYINTNGTGTYVTSNTIRSSTNVPHLGLSSSLEFNKNIYIDVFENDNACFGSADFTIECWVYVDLAQAQSYIFSSEKISIFVGDGLGSADLSLRVSAVGVDTGAFVGTLTIGQWSHVALVRSDNTLSFYQNSNLIASQTVNVSLGNTTNFSIGRLISSNLSTHTFQGNLADIRIVRGTAVYPAATFPTTADTTSLGPVTSLNALLSMSRDFKNNPRIALSYPSQFVSSFYSLQFNRSFAGIRTTRTANMSGDFTIEAWVNFNNLPSTVGASSFDIFAAGGWSFGVANVGGTGVDGLNSAQAPRLTFAIPARTTARFTEQCIFANETFTANAWTHVAVTRSNNEWFFFVGGNLISYRLGQSRDIRTFDFTSPGPLIVGRNVSGFISSALLTSGVARYTSSFTPPTTPYTATEPTQIVFSPIEHNTRLSVGDSISLYGEDTEIMTSDVPPDITGDFAIDFYFRPRSTRPAPEVWAEFGRLFTGNLDTLGIQVGTNPPAPVNSGVSVQPNYHTGYTSTTPTANERKLWVTLWNYGTNRGDMLISSNQCVINNEWNHVAIIRSSTNTNNVSVYVNNSLEITFTSNKPLEAKTQIGSARLWPAPNLKPAWIQPTNGDVSYVQIEASSAKNTVSNFNSKTAMLYSPEVNIDRYIAHGTTSYYLEKMPSPFATDSSLYFANAVTNSHLIRRHIDDSLLHSTPFTVEGWFYITLNSSTDNQLLSIWQSSETAADKPYIFGTKNLTPTLAINTGSAIEDVIVAEEPVKINQWYYFALSQDSAGDVRMYIGDSTQPEARLVETINNDSWFMTDKHNTKSYIASGFTGYISNLRESREALYTSEENIPIPTAPFSVTPSTIALYKHPYENNEYTYYENSSCILYKTNSSAFNTNSPFQGGVDGSISGAFGVIPADFTPDLNIGTQDFTLEWWCYIKSYKNNVFPVIQFGSIFNDINCILGARFTRTTTGVVDLKVKINGVDISLPIVSNITLSEWHHCAVVRSAGALLLYIDGEFISKIASTATSPFIDTPNNDGIVGALYSGSTAFKIDGNISNPRLVVGKVLYPDNDKPIAPLDNIPGTAFLYKAPYNNTYLSSGDITTVALTRTQSAADFYASPDKTSDTEDCMFFDGTKYLQIPDNGSTFNVGSNNEPFTIELWVLALRASGTQVIFSRGGGANSWGVYGYAYTLYQEGTTLKFQASVAGNSFITLNYSRFGLDKLRNWCHVAISYDGAVTSMYIDGVRVATNTTNHSYNYTKQNIRQFKLGANQSLLPNDIRQLLFGYISNMRIVKGDCLYSGSTPFIPTPIFSPTGTPNTVLLLQYPYDNPLEFRYQTSPFDPLKIESTPFIDGVKSLKTTDPIPQMSGDFTIEFWFYCLRQQIGKTFIKESLLDARSTGGVKTPFVVRLNDTAKKIRVYFGASSPAGATTSEFIDVGNVVVKTWHHFVIQRENNIISFYQDGELQGTINSTAVWGGNPLLIGRQYVETGYANTNFVGYLSNIRIVKDEAVYSSRKQVPTLTLPKDSNTTFLLKVGNDFNRSIITTTTNSLTADVSPKINTDANHYTAFVQKNPWNSNTSADFIAFPGDYRDIYFRFISNPLFNLNQAPFTFEAYIYHTVSSNVLCGGYRGTAWYVPWYQTIFSIPGFMLYISCEGFITLTVGRGTYPSTVDIDPFEWVHIALVSDPTTDNGKIILYVNGENSFEWIGPQYQPSTPSPAVCYIGTNHWEGSTHWFRGDTNPRFRGYMSNVRLMRGSIPRTIADTASQRVFSNTGTTTSYIVSESPDLDHPGSIYFNGGSNAYYISTTRADILPGEFTIEMYVKLDLASFTAFKYILHQGSNKDWGIYVRANGAVGFFARTVNSNGTAYDNSLNIFSSAGAIEINEWTHIAVTRNNNSDIFLYANGIIVATTNNNKQLSLPSIKSLTIGGTVKGFITNIRVNTTTCLYNTGIITPEYPLTAREGDTLLVQPAFTQSLVNYTPPYTDEFTPPQGPLDNLPGTALLLQGNYNTDGKNAIALYSASVTPDANEYNNSDAYSFNGANYVYFRNVGHYGLHNDKFIINFWFKPEGSSTKNRFLLNKKYSYSIYLTTSNRLVFSYIGGSVTGDTILPLNQWHHVAVVGDKSRMYLYIDGVLDRIVSGVITTNSLYPDQPITIGAYEVTFGRGYQKNPFWGRLSWIPYVYSWWEAPITHYGFNGKISNLFIRKGAQDINTDIIVLSDIFNLVPNTQLLYQPPYGDNVYATSNGDTGFVLNTITPDNVSGLTFTGDGTKYLKTQILPSCPADITIEMWFYPTRSTSTTEMLIDARNIGSDVPWYIALNLQGTFNVGISCGSKTIIKSANNTYTPNTWNHVAVIRTKTTVALYLNQKLINIAKSNAVWNNKPAFIGKSCINTLPFKGVIYSIRIVGDANVYNTQLSMNSMPLPTDDAYTQILMPSSNLYHSNAGYLKYGQINSGDLALNSPVGDCSPITGEDGEVLHFQSTEYIVVPHSELLSLANESWTIEFWIFITHSHSVLQTVLRKGEGSKQSYALLINTNGTLEFRANGVDSLGNVFAYPATSNPSSLPINRWVHVCLVSSNNTTELYLNGNYNHTYAYAPTYNTNAPLYIGAWDSVTSDVSFGPIGDFIHPLHAYISNLRIVKGRTAYNSSISIPDAPFSENNTEDTYFNNVSLLLHGSGANNSTTIIDSSTNNYPLSANGNCRISTTHQQFDYTSIFFDGVGDYISSTTFNPAGVFGTSDFTVEFWIFATAAPQNSQTIISFNETPLNTGFSVGYTSTTLNIKVGNAIVFSEKAKWSLNAWHYIAISRVNNKLNYFIDGDFIRSINFSVNCTDGLQFIGRSYNTDTGFMMSGYIDELRITKNVGRYSANFTVPSTPLSAPINTGLLLQAPYTEFNYSSYAVEGIHIGGSLNKSTLTPIVVELDNTITLDNLFIHNAGTLHIPKNIDASLNIIGPSGLQITSEGTLNIN